MTVVQEKKSRSTNVEGLALDSSNFKTICSKNMTQLLVSTVLWFTATGIITLEFKRNSLQLL